MMDEQTNDEPNAASDRPGLGRRELIKRAAIAGGVVAWTAPTIQVLGTGSAWAGEDKKDDKKGSTGTRVICGGDKDSKPNYTEYTVLGVSGPCPPSCEKTANCTCTGTCTGAPFDVEILSGGGTIIGVNGAPVSSTLKIFNVAAGTTFLVDIGNVNQTYRIFQAGASTHCQEVLFHVSCSDAFIEPVFQNGFLALTNWFIDLP